MNQKNTKALMPQLPLALTTSLVILLMAPASVHAQNTAKEGLATIEMNLNNSKENLSQYEKNLQIVDSNLAEVAKAKDAISAQKNQVSKQTTENKKGLQKIAGQQKEIDKIIQEEANRKQQEEAKIKELELMIAKLRENISKRDQNLADYQLQKQQLVEENKIWLSRSKELNEQASTVAARQKEVSTTENDWKNKRKGYEGEISRWKKEIERQEKLNATYKKLAKDPGI